jgi:ketopantoate reductase
VVALRRDHLREAKKTPAAAGLVAQAAGLVRGAKPRQAVPPPILFLNCGEGETREMFPELFDRDGGAEAPRVLHALTLWTSVRLEPGTVELASPRSVFLTVKDPELRTIVSALRAAGVEVAETDQIDPWQHSFFLWQLLFLPMAMCHAPYEYFLSYSEGREIATRVWDEGLRTLERAGAQLRKLPIMDPRDLLSRWQKARPARTQARFEPDRGYNSLLQALLRGEKTEAGELNERLVKRAAEGGVEATWNWRLARKLSRVVQMGFYRDPAELYQALS